MANTVQLKKDGQIVYPITDRSCIIGLEEGPVMSCRYAWDGTTTPDVTKIPAGVTVEYNSNTYTGTLAASASTVGYQYLVYNPTSTEFDRYATDATGGSYAWKAMGDTTIQSPDIADNLTTNDSTKALSAKQGKILNEELEGLEAELYGETHTYTTNATGSSVALSPNLVVGMTITSIVGVSSVYLIDSGGGGKTVAASSLPFAIDKTYTLWSAYASGSPEVTMTVVESGGLVDDVNELVQTTEDLADRIDGNDLEIEEIKETIYGETLSYTTIASGSSVALTPNLDVGMTITAIDGVSSIYLVDADGVGSTLNVSSLPFSVDKKYTLWSAYAAGSPQVTMTVLDGGGVAENIETIANQINGEKNIYTRNANGSTVSLTPFIKEGETIESIVGGVESVVLYDASNNSTYVSVSNLPFVADKEYRSWAAYVSGSPEITMTVVVKQGIEERLEVVENELDNSIVVHLPGKIYAVVGDTLQLFYRAIVGDVDPYVYDIVPNCSKGNHYPRYWQFTPVAGDVGTYPFTITIKDKNGKVLGTKGTTIEVVDAPSSPVSGKNVFCLGDSLTSGGDWCCEAKRRLVKTNTVDGITGDGLTNIEFCGSKQVTQNETTVNFFGVGGWTWNNYISAGTPGFRFYVSGVSSISVGATYTNNGHTYTVVEVNLTAGAGNILCTTSSTSNTPTESGILTKASGNGDSSVSFSSNEADVQNPLWDSVNNKMSFVPYVNEVGGGQIDALFVLLSWNGMSSWREYSIDDVSGHIADAKVFLDTLHDEFPYAKCFVMGLQMPSINGGLGANYGASGGYIDRYGLFETAFSYNDALEALCLSDDYNDFCEFVPVAPQFDSENNMPYESAKVNIRNSATEVRGTNGVHPATPGYYQIADAVYRSIVANFCQ